MAKFLFISTKHGLAGWGTVDWAGVGFKFDAGCDQNRNSRKDEIISPSANSLAFW